MSFVIWRHQGKLPSLLPTLVSCTVAIFLLHKEQAVWKGSQCLLCIRLFPITTFLCWFLSPDRVIFSQEFGQMLIQLSTVNAVALTGWCQEKSLACCSLFSGLIDRDGKELYIQVVSEETAGNWHFQKIASQSPATCISSSLTSVRGP